MKKTKDNASNLDNSYIKGEIGFLHLHTKIPVLLSSICFLGLAIILSLNLTTNVFAQATPDHIRLIRDLEIEELGVQNPSGIAFSQRAKGFHVLESGNLPDSQSGFSGFVLISSAEERIGFARLAAAIDNPSNIAFDNKFNRLLFLQTKARKLITVETTLSGSLDPSSLERYDVRDFNLLDPQGMAVDPDSGRVFILDSALPHIVSIQPAADGSFRGAEISHLPLVLDSSAGLVGLAYDPTNGHYFVVNQAAEIIYELDGVGDLVSLRDLSSFNFVNPQSMVFAPSGDPTDDPAIMNLYLVDAEPTLEPTINSLASETELLVQGSNTSAGRIVELSMHPLPQLSDAVPTDSVTLVRTTDTSLFSPPSPDPSGLTYLSGHPTSAYTNKLLISDGEVDEITSPNPADYTGYNLFLTNLLGSLTGTLTTYNPSATPPVTFSREPTGVTYNPANHHLYFTDDNAKKVNDLDPGSDGLYNTIDDVINFISTNDFGSTDPEGITFDSTRGNGHVIIVDGVAEEVYDIDLGSNGTLEQTDAVSQFDVTSMGIRDPEGIVFNADDGNLYILSSQGADALIAVTTINGTLLRYLDISATNADKPAGLALAPPSAGGGGKNIYIVDRAVDNNSNPLENDGKMYEVSFPSGGNAPPTVNAGTDQTITLPSFASLDGTVSDDGLPNPPGIFTTSWTKTSGPGTVTFGDANAVDTTASFSTSGVYVLRLTANDSALSSYDEVTITVNPQPPTNQPPTVNAGLDQTITLPSNASLDGTVGDDGLPNPPGSFTTSWTKNSGPGTVTFGDASAVDTTASFSTSGVYVLRLTANDSALSSYDEVSITVNPQPPTNQPPTVNAGLDQTITLPSSASLDGTVGDDGLPNPPGIFTTSWTKTSGPGTVTFGDASAVDTTASFSTSGVYVLRLTANDGALSSYDEVFITVNPQPPTNQPPTVNAGPDQTITLPSFVSLDGTVGDDGLPAPPSLTTTWSQVSGPGTITFGNPNAVDTTATFSTNGVYVLQLEAFDGLLGASDVVSITVNPQPPTNQPPAVYAGSDQTITLPGTAFLDGTVTDDGLPGGGLTTSWNKMSGPGTVTFTDPNSIDTTARFSTPGDYVLRLTAIDGALSNYDEVLITVNPAPEYTVSIWLPMILSTNNNP